MEVRKGNEIQEKWKSLCCQGVAHGIVFVDMTLNKTDTKKMKEDYIEYTGLKDDLKGLQFFTYEEVARIMKVKRSTVRMWIYRGLILRTIRMGRSSVIPRAELERFIKSRTVINESKAFKDNGGVAKPLKSAK